ncbi:MAG: hypothetical protein RSD77_09835 [Romboutsia sp.]
MNNQLRKLKKELKGIVVDENKRYIQIVARNGKYLVDLRDHTVIIGNKYKRIDKLDNKYETATFNDVDIEKMLIVGMSSDQVTIILNDIPED